MQLKTILNRVQFKSTGRMFMGPCAGTTGTEESASMLRSGPGRMGARSALGVDVPGYDTLPVRRFDLWGYGGVLSLPLAPSELPTLWDLRRDRALGHRQTAAHRYLCVVSCHLGQTPELRGRTGVPQLLGHGLSLRGDDQNRSALGHQHALLISPPRRRRRVRTGSRVGPKRPISAPFSSHTKVDSGRRSPSSAGRRPWWGWKDRFQTR